MQVYRIGPARGAQRVGYARDPETVRAKMQESAAEPLTVRSWDVDTGRAMLALRLLRIRMAKATTDGEWFFDTPAGVERAITLCLEETTPERVEEIVSPLSRADHAAAMLHLRTKVFDTTQGMMGVIAGRSAAIVSRWEAGATTPGLDELLRLRAFAQAVGIPWEDTLLLDPPTT